MRFWYEITSARLIPKPAPMNPETALPSPLPAPLLDTVLAEGIDGANLKTRSQNDCVRFQTLLEQKMPLKLSVRMKSSHS